ncbi:thioredoxin family protein [Lentibacillus saliphilus]|uniref:thioredoxin family protein n=1 Tax=Lentibacillus saliphilus TaxID=2737028 RepID=UPI001FE3A93D|nr:thioredoxin family protein [Lentibacillus saliphilus]
MTEAQLQEDNYLLYIHTPFCGTCHLARTILDKIEAVHGEHIFFEMNASLFPDFMQAAQVESVPCLMIKQDGHIKEKVYAFQSTANIYNYLLTYKPELFVG